MRLFLLITLIVLLGSAPPGPSPVAQSHRTVSPSPDPLTPEDLFSRRALRRARLLIQMRMMQFREERLECIRAALRRRLPDSLWPEQPSSSRATGSVQETVEHCGGTVMRRFRLPSKASKPALTTF